MAYETPITVKKAIENIRKRKYVLPSIQREFVWQPEQIEKLFDSLMRDYPISTFLFWKVEKDKIKDFQFYEFLKHYHEKTSKHNTKADLGNEENIIAILDGQQRMTSLFIALTGSYTKKLPYYSWDNPNGFPKKKLYLNLLSKAEDIEMEYDFQFLTSAEAKNEEGYFWFECSQILQIEDPGDINIFLMENDLMNTSIYSKEQSKFAINTLSKLYNNIHQKGVISYYLEEDEELDKVLQIFIRINSGGTKLSYSDLLLSIATAQWKEKDAREVIHEFVDDINSIGDGFAFNKDFVLKSCLVLADFNDVKFKVDNFTKENMAVIESNWEKASACIRKAVELISKYGYNRDNLLATTSVIPVAYFIYTNNYEDAILHSSSREVDRKKIKEWLARVSLKGTFGGTPDAIYPVMRNLMNENPGRFPLEEIIDYYRGKRKSISFNSDDIENILEMDYGKARTYCALSLLYPSLNHNFKYHQDHIHPKSFFRKRKLSELGIEEDDMKQQFISRYNKLSNLQLLQANQNTEKSDIHFSEWLYKTFPSDLDAKAFLMQNHIKTDQSLGFEDFIDFYETRKLALKRLLESILNVKETEQIENL
ncbi:DUF262 domain-containing protein [Salegentibacter maritimus]|uniref:DUF262 domain-containing protein n=1 Tax=Salegentibacter maritimus TaxID=2794347 RepID=UPI0018E4964B|nr:DUF262 domain-containing protein [Salegentibacter maritimus]MBI6117946.1 DUF262 domain-containing protein [Salegentibacter maritimus]